MLKGAMGLSDVSTLEVTMLYLPRAAGFSTSVLSPILKQ